jgi:thiaminase
MNSDANKFVDILTRKFSSVLDKILHHPYLLSVEGRKLSRENLKVFVCEQYHIISNDKRNFALVASRTSNSLCATLFQECLSFESVALDNLSLLANELRLDTAQLKSYEPLAGCQAYTNYLTKLASSGSEAVILIAMLTDLPIWGKNCGRISSALKKNYGFTEDSCLFLDRFATPLSEEFLKKSNEVIEARTSTCRKEMVTAARLILDYELMFWDSIYQYSIKN